MTYAEKLLALDKRLKMQLPMAPVEARIPTKAETDVRAALRDDNKHHAKVIEAAGVYRA